MADGPTQGAREVEDRRWHASPVVAFGLRAAAVLIPFLTAWLVVRAFADQLFRPGGWQGTALWVLQAAGLGLATSLSIERLTRRLLPLAAVYSMSLVFPDEAPSRFGAALRGGTLRKLSDRTSATPNADPEGAAERAVDLIFSIGQHDRKTRGHTERVRAYADLIAEELGLDQDDRDRLAWGALLHDVGKLTVPAHILNGAGRPSEEDWAVLKGHPAASSELLAPLASWLGEWGRAAGEHHERWDGAGYPNGLSGRDISLAGRIVAVADAYDVITSKRSYKKPMSATAARQELVRCAGTQFDPDVVRAFLGVSVGRRWLVGPLAWITEIPVVSSVIAASPAAPAVIVASVATVGSVALGVMPILSEPAAEPLAFSSQVSTEAEFIDLEATQTSTATDEGTPDQGTDGNSEPTPTTNSETGAEELPDTTTEGPDEASDSSTTTADSGATSTTTDVGSSTTSTSSTSSSTTSTTSASTTSSSTTTTTEATTTTTTTAPTTTTTTAPTTTSTTSGAVGMSWALDDTTAGEIGNFNVRVLTNDSPPNAFDYLSLRIVEPPEFGTAVPYAISGDPTKMVVQFLAPDGFVGTDTFVYEICDTGGGCAQARGTVNFI